MQVTHCHLCHLFFPGLDPRLRGDDSLRGQPPPGPSSPHEKLLRLFVSTLSTLIWFLLIAGVVLWWVG